MAVENPGKIRFASYVFDRTTGDLTREGIRLRLEKQPAMVLELLIAARGHLVTREQLVAALWPGEVSGEFDRRLDKALTKLRAALNDSPHAPTYVETLKGRGYRFLQRVTIETGDDSGGEGMASSAKADVPPELSAPVRSSDGTSHASKSIRGSLGFTGLVLFLVALLAVSAYAVLHGRDLQISEYTQLTHDGWRKVLVGVDSSHIYMHVGNNWQMIERVSLASVPATAIPLEFLEADFLDLAPDGSEFLLAAIDKGQPGLWTMHLPDGALKCLAQGVSVTAAAWSPDRKTIVFASAASGFFTLHSDGSQMRALGTAGRQNVPSPVTDLRWAPDGSRLRFTSNHTIWEMKPDGSGIHAVFPGLFAGSWQCCGRWSMDGKHYIFSVRDSLFGSLMPANQLWSFDEHGAMSSILHGKPVRLTNGPMRWDEVFPSQQDASMAYARGMVLRGQLMRFNDRSGRVEPFLSGISAESVVFSPDRRFLCYVSFPEGILWKAWRDGSHPVQLTDSPLHPTAPRWSPDGSLIAFDNTGATEGTQVWAVSASGGPAFRLIPEEKKTQSDPAWSPDGARLAYSTHSKENSCAPEGIHLYDRRSHKITHLPSSTDMGSVRWSPDGSFLIAMDLLTRSLWRFDFASSKWTHLEQEHTEYPNLSSDGHWVYFLRPFNPTGVYRIPASGGKLEKIADLTGISLTGYFSMWFGLDDQDTPMVLKDSGIDDIYALHLR